MWSALWTPDVPKPNAECPLCGEPVVIASTTSPIPLGPLHSPVTRDEKIASCATHGRPPVHNQTLRATGVTKETEATSD